MKICCFKKEGAKHATLTLCAFFIINKIAALSAFKPDMRKKIFKHVMSEPPWLFTHVNMPLALPYSMCRSYHLLGFGSIAFTKYPFNKLYQSLGTWRQHYSSANGCISKFKGFRSWVINSRSL